MNKKDTLPIRLVLVVHSEVVDSMATSVWDTSDVAVLEIIAAE